MHDRTQDWGTKPHARSWISALDASSEHGPLLRAEGAVEPCFASTVAVSRRAESELDMFVENAGLVEGMYEATEDGWDTGETIGLVSCSVYGA